MQRTLLALVAVLAACHRAPDPLAEHRALCKELDARKQLRPGLTVERCAQELKERADLADPGRKAEELVERIARLVQTGRGKPQSTELKDALGDLQLLGRPAVSPALAQLKTSADPEVRIALARVLVASCADDCKSSRYDCIVPALLEGAAEDKPSDVRREAEKGLMRCTGEQFGDDPAAWRKWWAERSARAAR